METSDKDKAQAGESHSHSHAEHDADLHGHPHSHGGMVHEHAHHHRRGAVAHTHGHALTFEAYSDLCSPIHQLDPRAKILSALILVFAVVLGPALRPVEFALLSTLLLAVTVISEVPLRVILLRSALVLPVAGTIALFAPLARHSGSWDMATIGATYSQNWMIAWVIVSKAWMSAYSALLVAATTPPPRLFHGLRSLKMPEVFVTMLVFLYRYGAVLSDQLRSLRLALSSRGFNTRGRHMISLYGNLAGNMFIRAYERGERVYSAMLSRGFTGTLPSPEPLRMRLPDALTLFVVLLSSAALLLY